ncbi:hypothetical protein [Zavarzinia marina]|uniref:hypothetical protein n=1 Tax=Zavarzinia marina TaxID=2911065 RepID=UPI001F29833A|nr:hypothetical protein [Zavarzinia marina]
MALKVRRLEQTSSPASLIVLAYGSFDAFAAHVQIDIDACKLDQRDMAAVVNALRGWEINGVWHG